MDNLIINMVTLKFHLFIVNHFLPCKYLKLVITNEIEKGGLSEQKKGILYSCRKKVIDNLNKKTSKLHTDPFPHTISF